MPRLKPIVVIGLGNPLMSDEGIGVRVLEKLTARAERFPNAEFLDLGASSVNVMHAIAGRARAVFIDCAFMGEPAGTIRAFAPDDVRSGKSQPGLSLHEGDLLAALDLSRRLGEIPPVVRILGIQPLHVGMGQDLSPALRARLDEYAECVAREITGA